MVRVSDQSPEVWKMSTENLALQVDEDTIHPVNTVRDLGVTLDGELSMQRHVNKVACSCFHHIRRLKQVHRLLGRDDDVTMRLVSAFVLSRLDYSIINNTARGQEQCTGRTRLIALTATLKTGK